VCVHHGATFLLFINSFLEPQCHVSLITDMFSIANRTQGPIYTFVFGIKNVVCNTLLESFRNKYLTR